jgi:UDPglucose 6-dehydrogenase
MAVEPVTGISVIGLGKLGAPLAALLAAKGFEVVGVDRDPRRVGAINEGRAPVDEPGLQQLMDEGRARLSATEDFAEAVKRSEVTFVLVPTPSGESGAFSNQDVLAAVEKIGEALRRTPRYHVVAIVSTVMPGSTEGEIRRALELHSGRSVGRDLGLCYNPEFVALGSVVRNLLAPDMILIGESDARAGELLARIYARLCENAPAVQRMSLINAELTKIAVNTYVTTKISYANMLADICERLPGADVSVVTDAIGRDSRIGQKYLSAATGYGGPCFPRDNVAFAELARILGARADLAQATHALNRYQIDRLVEKVRAQAAPPSVVGILGLSYKSDTGVIEESTGLELAVQLSARGYRVVIYDPRALPAAAAVLGEKAVAAASAADCARQAEVLVIATAWPEFRLLPIESLERARRPLPVIDCWRLLDAERLGAVVDLIYIGRAPAPSPAAAERTRARGA